MAQPELQGPAPQPSKLVKVSIFLTKRADISDEYFHSYWYNNHTALFLQSKAFKTLVRKYNQSHFDKEQKALNSDILVGMPQVEFDGVAEFWVDSLEDWRKLWTDPEFTTALAGDSDIFTGALHTTAGYDYLFKEDLRQPIVGTE